MNLDMEDSKVAFRNSLLLHRNYFVSRKIKSVYIINKCDIYKNAHIKNREKNWSFHYKDCAFEIYHIERKISASEVFQINELKYWFRYFSVIMCTLQ